MLEPISTTRKMNFGASRSETAQPWRDHRLVEGVLANLPMLKGATPRERTEVASYAWLQTVRRGSRVFRAGQAVTGIFAVAYGMLKLELPRARGDGRVLRFVGSGETFGEAPVLVNQPSPYDATALADSMLIVIPGRALLRLIERQPAVAQSVVTCLADRYLGVLADVRANVRWRGEQRLASYLVSIAQPNGDSSWTAHLPTSKTAVAARLGMSKETLSRMLRRLSDRGLIAVSQREIALLDRERLAGAVG